MAKKYIDADLLRKEIERRKNNVPLHYHPHACTSVISELEELLAFLDSLQQEQPDKSLEEEIETWIPAHISIRTDETLPINPTELAEICKEWGKCVARHFAEWQKEQMLKDAIHYVVQDDLDSHGASYNIPFIRIGTVALKPKGIGVGDKVKVIVLKEEEE